MDNGESSAAGQPGELVSATPGDGEDRASPPPPSLFQQPAPPEPISALIGSSGGELVTGDYRVALPGLEEPAEVWLVPIRFEEIWQPRPLSTPLAAAELRPYWTSTEGMFDLTLPLRMELPEGMTLQLLAFNRSMDAFFVADERPVSPDGLARFRTDVFTQYVVIATPELQDGECLGGHLHIEDSVPSAPEADVVGQVEETERMRREDARQVLSDMRYFPTAQRILFKDEEQRDLDGEGQAPWAQEDYLFDPRLAAALEQIGANVLTQWTDPISEGPAFQLRITEGFDSRIEHSPTSNHYRGRSADLTLSPIPASTRAARREYYGRLARLAVCAGLDFVDFEDRFHIHVSVRPTRIAYVEESAQGRGIVACDLDGSRRVEVSRQAAFPIDDLDVRALAYSDDGNSLDVFGRRKGNPQAARIDLIDLTVQTMTPPDPLPRPEHWIIIDASLRLETRDGRILVHRPLPPDQGSDEEMLGQTEPFSLTPPGVSGWHPTVWHGIGPPSPPADERLATEQ